MMSHDQVSLRTIQTIATALVCSLFSAGTLAGIPQKSDLRKQIIGNPVVVEITPTNAILDGPRATRQILVTGHYSDGKMRDLTPICEWHSDQTDRLTVTAGGLVSSLQDGTAEIHVKAAELEFAVSVSIRNASLDEKVHFQSELVPALSKAGCSDIRCHGSPSGKDGFRLSLWGSDPEFDFRQLTHDMHGRRTNALEPDSSLVLKKALGRVPHVGGRRFLKDSPMAGLFRQWQSDGMPDDNAPTMLRSLTISPQARVLHAPARWQQLSVLAEFSDNQLQDVTQLTTFSSSDPSVASVDRNGLVEFSVQGEVAILCRYMDQIRTVRLAHIEAPSPDYHWPDPPRNNFVDDHVFAKLKLLNIAPSELCSDEQFIRRLYIDLCGKLPPRQATESFLNDRRDDKRARLVDRLLSRPEFAEYWTKKWLDVLRISRDAVQWTGARAYQTWLTEQFSADVPLTEIVSEMLLATGKSFTNGPVNFYCAPQIPMGVTDTNFLQKDLAEATAQLFMGVRFQCARCHNHPYERWTQQDYLGLAAHFTDVKRERLGKAGPSGRAERRQIAISLDYDGAEITHSDNGSIIPPQLPGQPVVPNDSNTDKRQSLATWLIDPANPFFARAVANRVWYHLNGRGIVEPVDDFRDSNPPSNDALLAALATRFQTDGFRLKPLIRSIVNSRTYQLSPTPNRSNRDDHRYFSHMSVRPLAAEVLLDSIGDVTGRPEQFQITADYTIGVPEGFVDLPNGIRAVQLPVNDVVTLINSSSKYVRYESHPFLRAFGQPTRTQTCECDREQHFGRKQALELLIGEAVSRRLSDTNNRLGQLLAAEIPDREILDAFYLTALCRRPSETTVSRFLSYISSASDRRTAWEDVLWTILNSHEFISQH